MTLFMFDNVNARALPPYTEAFAGYVNGRIDWQSYQPMVRRFPHVVANQHDLSITVVATALAKCLDVETGDATPSQAGEWVLRAMNAHIWKPCLYANLSTMPLVIADLHKHRVQRTWVRLWVAHFDDIATIPSGYDAKQYTDKGFNGCDESVLLDSFFPQVKPPVPPKPPDPMDKAEITFDPDTKGWTIKGLA